MNPETITATQALALLLPVPAQEWITGDFTDENRACCAIGHLKRLTSPNPGDYSYRNCEARLDENPEFFYLWEGANPLKLSLSEVNNGPLFHPYPLSTPKDRVIAFLTDLARLET